jgi:hypothetical protein
MTYIPPAGSAARDRHRLVEFATDCPPPRNISERLTACIYECEIDDSHHLLRLVIVILFLIP